MMEVVVVGVGALGSHVVPVLRNVCPNLVVVDSDRVDRKNVLSQFHGQNSVGKSKAIALQQLMQFMFSYKIGAIPHRLTSLNVNEILGKAGLVLDCLDNGNSRRIVQNLVRERRIPCLHGTLAAKGELGRVIWDEQFEVDDEPKDGAATCENGDFLPFIALVASKMAHSANQFLVNGKKIGFHITPSKSIPV